MADGLSPNLLYRADRDDLRKVCSGYIFLYNYLHILK